MRRLGPAIAYVATAVLLLPLAWMVATSLKPPGEYVSTSIALLPDAPTLMHYRALLGEAALVRLMNSVIVAVGTTALSLAVAVPAAYALVRMRLPARLDIAFLVFVLVLKLVPPLVLAIPLYQMLRALMLLDTLPGLVLAYQVYTLPFAIWMLLGFVRDVPEAVEEAATMDGANLFRRITLIVVPMMAPGIAATAVLLAILSWNEFAYALLFIQTPSNFTLPTYIATLITEDETFWGRLSAIGLIASLPILILLAVFQRTLMRGLTGGVK